MAICINRVSGEEIWPLLDDEIINQKNILTFQEKQINETIEENNLVNCIDPLNNAISYYSFVRSVGWSGMYILCSNV